MVNYKKINALLSLAIVIVAVILVNVLAAEFVFRIDLTQDKRYSVSEATRQLLKQLDDQVYIEVYLTGEDLPAGFKRLQKSVKENLDIFRAYGGDNIQYKFIDPIKDLSETDRNKLFVELGQKGIQPTNIMDTENGKRSEKIVLPGAILTYQDKEAAIMLLSGNRTDKPQEILNQSIENVEYELATSIRQLTTLDKYRIGIVSGHGELEKPQISDFANILKQKYDLFKVDIAKEKLNGYDALIIAKPVQPFSELEKYNLDQYIVNGGKVVFFIDAVKASMDSLSQEGTYAFNYNHNLDDLFFKYGVRINSDLIVDLYGSLYPIVTGYMGNQPQVQLMPWPFFPIVNTFGNSPVVKNLDAVWLRFASSIDTVKASGIIKTPLLFSSKYSKKVATPVKINLNDLRKDMSPEVLKMGPIPVAYLLEGSFNSLFTNRFLPENANKELFKNTGTPTKILIVADGDMIASEMNTRKNEPFPLGFDLYSQNTYANIDFVNNALEYMLDDNGLITSKKKDIKIRPLDKVKIQENKAGWQLLNIAMPVIIIILLGIIRFFLRKRRFERF